MANNYISEGETIVLNVGTGKKSGDPVVVGELAGVCLVDADANGDATVALEGIFNLEVVANDGTAGAAVNIGDALYYDAGVINKNANKTLFGYALESIAAGSTATIPVKIANK